MNFDLESAKKEFSEYVNGVENNKTISRKVGHSYRVMEISRELANRMSWKKEDIEIATLIGLLHDIAKVNQNDKKLENIDHGDRGVEILQENNFIRKFIEETKYDNMIFKAIKNHNKYEIEKKLSPQELKFVKLIRDSDKLDIFYEAIEMFFKEKQVVKQNNIPIEIKQFYQNKKTVIRQKDKFGVPLYSLLNILSFIFDLNFAVSFEKVEKNKYVSKIIGRFIFEKEQMKKEIGEIEYELNEYVKQKIKEV